MRMHAKAESVKTSDEQRVAEAVEPIPTPPLKVVFDKLAAVLALILLVPVFALIALAIEVDGWLHPENRGPVLYTEDRVSQGRVFLMGQSIRILARGEGL